MRTRTATLITLALVLAASTTWALWSFGTAPPSQLAPAATEPAAPAQLAADPATTPPAEAPSRHVVAPDTVAGDGIRITVTDRAGTPIAGALVQTFDDSTAGRARTDALGLARLAVPPGDSAMRLRIDASGFYHVQANYPRRRELSIALPAATTLRGTVRSQTSGTPIAGAEIRCPHNSCKGCEPLITQTDTGGHFELADLPAHRQQSFFIIADGYPVQFFRHEITSAPQAEHDFALRDGVALRGQIIDFTTAQPVSGVTVRDALHTGLDIATGDGDGRFAVRALRTTAGAASVELRAEGYCQLTVTVDAEGATHAKDLRIRMPRSASFAGIVRDGHGDPVEGVAVRIVRDQRGALEQPATPLDALPAHWRIADERLFASATTDARGRYRTTGVVPWSRDRIVRAAHPAFLPAVKNVAVAGAAGTTTEVLFTLQSIGATGTIHGTLSFNGSPVAGRLYWKSATRNGSAFIDSSGMFRLDDVATGAVQLSVRTDRNLLKGVDMPGRTRTVQVAAGGEVRCDFALELELTSVEGTVRFRDGDPVAKIPVAATNDRRLRARTRTGEDGRYHLEVPAGAGPLTVLVAHGPTDNRRDGVVPGTQGVDFVVERLATLVYRAVDEQRHPIDGADIFWRRAGDDHWHAGPRRSGWRQTELAPGQYHLMALSPNTGHAPAQRADIAVTTGAPPPRVEIAMAKGATVHLRRAEGLAPWPDTATVLLLPDANWPDVQHEVVNGSNQWRGGPQHPGLSVLGLAVHFDHEGVATLRGLAPGRYRFKVFGGDFRIEPEFIEVSVGVTTTTLAWR